MSMSREDYQLAAQDEHFIDLYGTCECGQILFPEHSLGDQCAECYEKER